MAAHRTGGEAEEVGMSKPYVLTPNNVRVPAPRWCAHTTVDARSRVIINGIEHGGAVSHKCSLKEVEHPEYCQCACGHQWRSREAREVIQQLEEEPHEAT